MRKGPTMLLSSLLSSGCFVLARKQGVTTSMRSIMHTHHGIAKEWVLVVLTKTLLSLDTVPDMTNLTLAADAYWRSELGRDLERAAVPVHRQQQCS